MCLNALNFVCILQYDHDCKITGLTLQFKIKTRLGIFHSLKSNISWSKSLNFISDFSVFIFLCWGLRSWVFWGIQFSCDHYHCECWTRLNYQGECWTRLQASRCLVLSGKVNGESFFTWPEFISAYWTYQKGPRRLQSSEVFRLLSRKAFVASMW